MVELANVREYINCVWKILDQLVISVIVVLEDFESFYDVARLRCQVDPLVNNLLKLLSPCKASSALEFFVYLGGFDHF
jgi:hypothetical protein